MKFEVQIFSARATQLEYLSALAEVKYGSAQTFCGSAFAASIARSNAMGTQLSTCNEHNFRFISSLFEKLAHLAFFAMLICAASLSRFRTTVDFDCEYLWNGSSNRQAENGVMI